MAFVATRRPEESRLFYEGVLGLPLVGDEPYALVFDAHGTTLRVQKVDEVSPVKYTVLGWTVPDIRVAVERLGQRGVVFERYGSMPQDKLGIWTSPSGAKIAWFQDPDGNTLSLTELP
jgi:catechol 2,3-dioxygenase-like lactoylglutathione lyase family enzyme